VGIIIYIQNVPDFILKLHMKGDTYTRRVQIFLTKFTRDVFVLFLVRKRDTHVTTLCKLSQGCVILRVAKVWCRKVKPLSHQDLVGKNRSAGKN